MSIVPESVDLATYSHYMTLSENKPRLPIFGVADDIDILINKDNYIDSYEYMRSLTSIEDVYTSNYFVNNFLL